MAVTHVMNMAEAGKVAIDRVKEPEGRDVRRREIRESCAALTPSASENAALRRQNFHQSPGNPHQVIVCGDIQEWRNVLRIQLEEPSRSPQDARDLKRVAAFPRFSLDEKAQVFPGNLYGPLGEAAILVSQIDDF